MNANSISAFFIIAMFVALYFLPTIVANARKRMNVGAIFIVNLVFGWTMLGWIIALIWAISTTRPAVVYIDRQA